MKQQTPPIPVPWSIWLSSAILVLYSIYLLIITIFAQGAANLLEIVVLLLSLACSGLIMTGMPSARTLLMAWVMLLILWLAGSLFLADFSGISGIQLAGVISLIALPVVDIGALALLFTPSAHIYFGKKTARRVSRNK